MVDFVNRDKNDIFGMPVLSLIFKNRVFLRIIQVVVFTLFLYAIYFGFINPTKEENLFTTGLFWGLFWPFFMVVSLGSFGRIFCGLCPHGFIGKYITRFGLKKKVPKNLANPFIGVFLLFIGWWFTYYMYPDFFKTPYATAILFVTMTFLAVVFYYIYDEMAYCKYICPIGTMTKVFSKVSFTKLETYSEHCQSCRTFECASVCSYDLKPFTFEKKNSMEDCTLCMDCSSACESVAFKFKKPSSRLLNKFKTSKSEVWALIFITAAISITMGFHHSLGRSAIVEEFFWTKTARYFESFIDFGSIDVIGLFAFLYAVLISVLLSVSGMFIASRIMKVDYEKTFYTLGYAFAPLFIIGGLSHIGEFFFYSYASNIVNGFNQAFALGLDSMQPLASRKDEWVHIFKVFTHIGYIWAFILMIIRFKLIDSKKSLKVLAFPFASALIIFYMSLNFYTGYVFKTYGAKQGGHNHSNHQMKMENK
jgi:ferredoxin